MNRELRRVVITGLGMVSPLGTNVQTSWQALISGSSGIVAIETLQECQNPSFPSSIYIAPVHKSFDHSKYKIPFTPTLTNAFLFAAAEEALNSAQWTPQTSDLTRTGVSIGCMNTNIPKLTESITSGIQKGFNHINRLTMLNVLTNMGTANLSVKYKLKGPSLTTSTACATGASAIGEAFRLIQLDEADIMIAGGGDESVNPVCVNSAMKMQAMNVKKFKSPEESSRPFDRDRAGFILGEGAGILILEELNHAIKRKAKIYAEIFGYGCACIFYSFYIILYLCQQADGYHLVKPLEDGDGGLRAMKRCLSSSGFSFKDVDHINCHATSTSVGDEAEGKAIINLFEKDEKYLQKVSITANKSQFGHCFAAAGAIETIFAVLSLENGMVPGIKNLENPIPSLKLDFVKETARKQTIKKVIKNSFGFGGVNVSLLFGKPS